MLILLGANTFIYLKNEGLSVFMNQIIKTENLENKKYIYIYSCLTMKLYIFCFLYKNLKNVTYLTIFDQPKDTYRMTENAFNDRKAWKK